MAQVSGPYYKAVAKVAKRRLGSVPIGGIPERGMSGPIRKQPVSLGPIPVGKYPPNHRLEHSKVTVTNDPTGASNERNKPIVNVNNPLSKAGDGEGNSNAPVLGATNTPVGTGSWQHGPNGSPGNNKAPGTITPYKGKPAPGKPAGWKAPGRNPSENKPDIAAIAARRAGK